MSRRALLLSAVSLSQLAVSADNSQCTLYMAPSSTAGEDEPIKLGMYAGVDIQPGTTIGYPEIAVPVIDIDLHNGVQYGEVEADFLDEQFHFMWTAETIHANFEAFPRAPDSSDLSPVAVRAAIPGIGALGNSHFTSFANADFNNEAVLNRTPVATLNGIDTIVPNSQGANSQYYDVTLQSNRFVPAGMEILTDNLGQAQDEDYLLEPVDFSDVDEALAKIQDFFNEHGKSIDARKKARIYSYLVNDVVGTSGTQSFSADGDRKDSQDVMDEILALFPHPSQIQKVLDNGGVFLSKFPELQKSMKWLKKNGQCLDGLYSGKSTIPGAEKGAFATRAIKKGELVSPAPLLLIPDKDYLDMYTVEFKVKGRDEYAERQNPKGGVVSKQLLLNYCFGHPESSLLFYPYGMVMNMINHKPTGKGANAKLVWTKAAYHDDEVLLETAEHIAEDYDAMLPLGMDVVAIRDIEADEELFLDYGSEWQRAWDKHVAESDASEAWPKEALYWNVEETGPFFTTAERGILVMEGKEDPIPEHIMTGCHIVEAELEDEDGNSRESPPLDGLNVYQFDEEETTLSGGNWRRCEVVERQSRKSSDEYVYTVRIYYEEDEEEDRFVAKVPHKNIRYADKPYKSSLHRQGSFRHPIGISDDIFPAIWRDLK